MREASQLRDSRISQDEAEARQVCEELKRIINGVHERRDSITPTLRKQARVDPLTVYRELPQTNCGECGYPACLAFAANVSKSGEDPHKCPYIDLQGLELSQGRNTGLSDLGREYDLDLIAHLKGKIQPLDFAIQLGIQGTTLPRNRFRQGHPVNCFHAVFGRKELYV